MRRRAFIAGLGAASVVPLAARAQQPDRVRRVGVLLAFDENDPRGEAEFAVFTKALVDLGWTLGRNLQMDVRWAGNSIDRMRVLAKELVDLRPEVILAYTTPATAALQRATRTIPIVFVIVSDPVGAGFVASLPRPGGNITGFINVEAAMMGKWLELLLEVAPDVKRVAIMFNPDTAPSSGSYYLPSFDAAARLLKVEPITAPVHDDTEIKTIIDTLGGGPRSGLVSMPDAFTYSHRAPIILQAGRSGVPTVYQTSDCVREGGLLSYGPDGGDIFRRAAPYVDRILRGANPTDLPVQLPVKFEMAVNVKTAKALGLVVPQSILLSANEVIE
jgi:putative tryptophan/tyrosine transport system substrate-binding protein